MDKGFWAILALVALAASLWIYRSLSPDPKLPAKEVYVAGKTDTLFLPGSVDTVYIYRNFETIVRVPANDIRSYGHDSSHVDTTIVFPDATITLGLSTFPMVDSLRFSVDLSALSRDIYRSDTLILSRIDTIKTSETVFINSPWYESWWVGSIITGLVALLLVGTK